jgi:hypothetical protein
MDILLPAEPLLQDVQATSLIRTQELPRISRLIVTLHATQQYRQPGLKYESLARALLTAELSETTSATAARLRKVLAMEFEKQPKLGWRHRFVLKALVEGFAWESVSNSAQLPTASWTLGPLFYGIQSLANGLIADVEKLGGGVNAIMFNGEVPVALGCFSPATFVKLMQKVVVLLLLHWKKFSDVILPTSLATDVLARRNAAYARALEQYASPEFRRTPVSIDRSCEAGKQLNQLVSSLFYLLEKITASYFQRWLKLSEADYLNKNAQDSFCGSILQLVLVQMVNSSDAYNRTKSCARMARLFQLPDAATLIVRATPLYLHRMISKLTVKELNRTTGDFQRNTGDPFLLVHCQHSCAVKIPGRFLSLQPTRRIMERGADGSIQLVQHVPPTEEAWPEEEEEKAGDAVKAKSVPEGEWEASEQVAVAAPHERTREERLQERLERYYTVLRHRAARARERLQRLSQLETLQRLIEREFVQACLAANAQPAAAEAGANVAAVVPAVKGEAEAGKHLRRRSPAAMRYKNEVCPLFLKIQRCSEAIQKAIKAMEAEVFIQCSL